MNTSPVNLRNLEQIQEGSRGRSPKLATFLLAATGSAAVFVAGMLLKDRDPAEEEQAADPLAALVADAKGRDDGVQLQAGELDFPDILSDADHRTTALVAVKGKDGRLVPHEEVVEDEIPKAEGMPTEPLAAGTLLNATQVTEEPKDELSALAAQAAKVPEGKEMAPEGHPGDYVIQVASFKNQDDADVFVADLRRRGHEAFRQAANVPDRGVWHRVRIGPFATKYKATLYKRELEDDERVTALVIDADKVERQQKIRAAKLAERIRKR